MKRLSIWAVALGISIAGLASISVWRSLGVDHGVTQTSKSGGESTAAPGQATIMQHVLGIESIAAQLRADRVWPKFWTGVEFVQSGVPHYVGLVELRKFDDRHMIETCERCIPLIAAATYKLTREGWTLVSASEVARIGAWGEPPNPSRVGSISIGGRPALAIENVGMHKGVSYAFLELLAFQQDQWRHVGKIQTKDDMVRGGQCTTDTLCPSWTGGMEQRSGSNPQWPDIVIRRSGTVVDSGKLIAAGPLVYVYSGTRYESTEQSAREGNELAAAFPTPSESGSSRASETTAGRWFIADRNHSDCLDQGGSPAKRLRMLQEAGIRPQVRDFPNGVVEVSVLKLGGTEEEVWTYYRSREACITNLPKSQAIPRKYE
ncbi:MAG: hypothetical protein K0Q55_2521 [Verrucomicrobia bacterium]|jgi:hypothetical protein|nr:hypothetical protein [Verrucomicrobiota bacterium]